MTKFHKIVKRQFRHWLNCLFTIRHQAVLNQNQLNIGGLAKLLKVKIGAKVMLTVNIDIQYRLVSGQTGNTRHLKFAQGSVWKVYVNFSDGHAGLKAI